MLRSRPWTFAFLGLAASALIASAPTLARLHGGISTGGGGNLTTATVINPVASPQTNMPYTQGLAFAPNAISASQHVEATDPGTGLAIPCQEDNRYSDRTSVRGESLTCIFPSVTSSQTKNPTYAVAAGAPATGTDITVGEISAWLTLNSYNLTVDFLKINGVAGTTTADLASALASGNSGWVNTTTATVMGKYRGGGGLLTEYVVYAPAKKSGTPDAQLHVSFDIGCYKALRTAVNVGTNPIVKCFVDEINENAFLQNGSPVDDYYGLCVTKSSACDVSNLANTTPTQTLSGLGRTVTVTIASPCVVTGYGLNDNLFSGEPIILQTTGALPTGLTAGTVYYADGTGGNTVQLKTSPSSGSYINCTGSQSGTQTASAAAKSIPITAGSALFSVNDIGRPIVASGGIAVINKYTDSTHVEANVYFPFTSNSVTSGGYTLYGTNHPFGTRFHYRTWLGTDSPTVQAGNVYLGATWNGGTLTGGPGTYLKASKLFMNYNVAASSVTNNLAVINSQGANPMGYLQCAFQNGGSVGDINCYLETSGQRQDIGVIPDWDLEAITRYDANASIRIFTNADRWQTFPIYMRDSTTGLVRSVCNAGSLPTCAGSTNYVWDGRFAGTPVPITTNSMSPWALDQMAHDPEASYTATVLTGDYFYTEGQQFYGYYAWAAPSSADTGIEKLVFRPPVTADPSGFQERGVWWALRTIADTALLTPDTASPVLVPKTVTVGLFNNEFDDATNGSQIALIGNTGATGSGKYFNTDGPHWTILNAYANATFEVGYGNFALFHMDEQGLLGTNGRNLRDWITKAFAIDQVTSPNVNFPALAVSQYTTLFDPTPPATCPTQVNSWTDTYRATSNYPFTNGLYRTPSATLTLSATSGSSVTATLSGGSMFGAGTAFYQNGWIYAGGGGGRITSIVNANTAIISTTVGSSYYNSSFSCQTYTGSTFSGTTFTTGNYTIPEPAPTDPVGTEWADYLSGHVANDELQIIQANAALAYQFGVTGGAAAYTASWAVSGGSMVSFGLIKWNILPR